MKRLFFLFTLFATCGLAQAQQKVDISNFYSDFENNQRKSTSVQYLREDINYEYLVSIKDFGEEVGRAFKTAGSTSLGVGVPTLIAGTILLGYGQGKLNNISKYASTKEAKLYSNCTTAGYVLMPIGAALTIVGIPLYIKGQHLLDLKIDYTGNGAGLALAW